MLVVLFLLVVGLVARTQLNLVVLGLGVCLGLSIVSVVDLGLSPYTALFLTFVMLSLVLLPVEVLALVTRLLVDR